MTTTPFPTTCDCETDSGDPLDPDWTLVSVVDDFDHVERVATTTTRYECDGCGARHEVVTPYGAE